MDQFLSLQCLRLQNVQGGITGQMVCHDCIGPLLQQTPNGFIMNIWWCTSHVQGQAVIVNGSMLCRIQCSLQEKQYDIIGSLGSAGAVQWHQSIGLIRNIDSPRISIHETLHHFWAAMRCYCNVQGQIAIDQIGLTRGIGVCVQLYLNYGHRHRLV